MPEQIQRTAPGRLTLLAAASIALLAVSAQAQTGRFDLLGPSVDVHVTRGNKSLPIASVPNLQPGDKLQVRADLPSSQSVHLLLVIAFLRGTTNPPPDKWFTRVETWKDHTHSEGVSVTVPDEAQQALIFIAPETGGDFSTLKSAVRGRPGTFVRASQDLNEASFEQSRIERYVQAIKQVPPGSPADLLDHSHKLAATLQLKPNDDCFKRAPDLQAACLSQTGSALLLDDGHGQTMAQVLTTGPSSDLIGAVAGTPVANVGGAAAYSAYVGTVLDVVRLLTGLHTAKYQYIPAIAFPDEDALNLRLNTAPSFNNPKSVIVIALPAIQTAVPPPLQSQDARHVACLLQPNLVLPLNGAPLVFATGFAHDLVLHLNEPGPDGRTDLPLIPNAYEGGLMVSDVFPRKALSAVAPEAHAADTVAGTALGVAASQPHVAAPVPAVASAASQPATSVTSLSGPIQGTGVVRGYLGFDAFSGPTLALQRMPGHQWTVATQGDLFAGRSSTASLSSTGTACVSSVSLVESGNTHPLDWHTDEGHGTPLITVKLPLEKSAPGGLSLAVQQYGDAQPQTVALTAYADAVRIEDATAHAGDAYLVLRGTGLAGVKSATVNGVSLAPAAQAVADDRLLRLEPSSPDKKPAFKSGGDRGSAVLALQDGRSLTVPYHVEAARPLITLLAAKAQSTVQTDLPITLGDARSIPLQAKLTLAVRSDTPSKFPRTEKLEVAFTDGSATTTLSLQDRTLVLQDARTALGFITPAVTFGPSGFGPLELRAVSADGTASDWLQLGILTRTPSLHTLACTNRIPVARAGSSSQTVAASTDISPPASQDTQTAATPAPCTLAGSDLFLIDAVSGSSTFSPAVEVPAGFALDSLSVPRPADGHTLYLRLRDDPAHIATVQIEPLKPKP